MTLEPSKIFVFGSNLAGRHGRGAAFSARLHYGAIYGQGVGLQGQSYAIPTKDESLKTLPLRAIKKHVDDFIKFAEKHPEMIFKVTPIGTGLAGYSHDDIAPMFSHVPENCVMPYRWQGHLYHNKNLKYWIS